MASDRSFDRTDPERRTLGDRLLERGPTFRAIDEAVGRVFDRFAAAHRALALSLAHSGESAADEADRTAARRAWDCAWLALCEVTSGFLTLEGRRTEVEGLFGEVGPGGESEGAALREPDPVVPPDDAAVASAGVGPPTDL